jgi:hypothetical protein
MNKKLIICMYLTVQCIAISGCQSPVNRPTEKIKLAQEVHACDRMYHIVNHIYLPKYAYNNTTPQTADYPTAKLNKTANKFEAQGYTRKEANILKKRGY